MIVKAVDIDWYEYLSKFGIIPIMKHKKRSQKQHEILNVFSAFDIETSTIWIDPDRSKYDVHSFMYIWQYQIEDYTVIGRSWEEYFDFLKLLKSAIDRIRNDYKLPVNPFLVTWVHNLAYEFSFISGLYHFQNEECFFRDVRKPIYCRMFDTFELRCSYIQTNMSLSALCKQTGVPEKLSGQKYDYDRIRYPWTELSDFELQYCIRDVESLVLAMKVRLSKSGDNLMTAPITSTGYVRRDCKQALKEQYLDIREIKPFEKEYRLLRSCFRGGNTHGNRYYVGKIVNDVYSYDISSSYPTQQLTKKFPMNPFKWLLLDDIKPVKRFERILQFVRLDFAVVASYQFKGLRLKNKREPIPYISLSRCHAMGFKLDNGRILYADYLEISLTEIDLKIIMDQYTFDEIGVLSAMVSKKDFLPQEYREVIMNYYRNKTSLKGCDDPEAVYLYQKSKGLLNAIYGMSATDPIHQEITYNDGIYERSDYETMSKDEITKALKNASFPYQWGVYTTAYAREQLQTAIKFCGDKIIYCDTDSVKTEGNVDIEQLNSKLKEVAIETKSYAVDMNGEYHYIGMFESDGHYDRFITQGAKRYAYEIDGHLGVTVAGVTKKVNEKTGVMFAVEELKDLKRFKPGMIWRDAGGTLAVYHDNDDFIYTDPESGKQVWITKNVSIVPTTYEMMYSKDYRLLLNEISLYGDYQRERS